MASIQIKIPDWLDKICTWPVIEYRRHKYGYSFRKIYLGEGEWTILEPQDYYRLRDFKWRLLGNGWNFYAVRDVKTKPYRTKVFSMHREIMNPPDGLLVDHRNNDSLDNRKANLRLATHSQNSCNRRKIKSKTSSRFIGVCFDKYRERWTAYIRFHGRRIWLGRFKNEMDAAKAYDEAARKYHGEFARLNFPDDKPFAVANYESKIENRLLMSRPYRAIVCYILFAMLIGLGCTAADKTIVLRSVDMATAKISLKDAKAKRVWEIFRQISAIPRCSKNESQIIEWLKYFAKSHNLACRTDAVGNTVIELPPTKGYENAPAIVLQSHVDMVCEKTPESKHDFSKDPIELVERNGWITADGTTLGADDGLGMALALALPALESRRRGSDVVGLAHPKLELLFTVDEETGLTGADNLQPGFITGKYLINLDGEDESFIVGCAGGENTEITLPLDLTDTPAGLDCFTLKVSGLYGGHSGVDIDKKRANAIKLLVRTLKGLQEQFDFSICSVDGGKAANAIPRDAQAIILLDSSRLDAVRKALTELESSFKKEFSKTDPNLKVELKEAAACPEQGRREKSIINNQSSIINLLSALPAGVYRMSKEFKGTVETSNNLARVETIPDENLIRITTMQRGFKLSSMDDLTGKIVTIARQAGADVRVYGRYPSWKPDTNSSLLKRAKEIHRKLNKKEPQVRVVHAGLECAVIGEKFPDIEMISVGPTIQNPHSPQERLNIASVDNAWKFLIELIPALK
ncbi:MAG: beta-Ala-His dipeptidase [Sedimentisphaerales bacterium]|nr:beta-Ala-His dipeptidase [Sedimentisphaerales bacterium]